MKNQEVFDIVAKHLLTQNKRSEIRTGIGIRCAYRTEEGLKCAVGVLIPDDIYDREMEGRAVRKLVERCPEVSFLRRNIKILSDLQFTHDNFLPSRWRNQLEIIAKDYKLDDKILHVRRRTDTRRIPSQDESDSQVFRR